MHSVACRVLRSTSATTLEPGSMAPAPVAQPTARPAYVLNEVLGKPSNDTGLEYINKFLAENNNNGQVAQADQ